MRCIELGPAPGGVGGRVLEYDAACWEFVADPVRLGVPATVAVPRGCPARRPAAASPVRPTLLKTDGPVPQRIVSARQHEIRGIRKQLLVDLRVRLDLQHQVELRVRQDLQHQVELLILLIKLKRHNLLIN